jgi:hypothetical protein
MVGVRIDTDQPACAGVGQGNGATGSPPRNCSRSISTTRWSGSWRCTGGEE